MESTLNFRKRKQPCGFVLEKCIICQNVRKGKDLRGASTQGLVTFKEAYSTRTKYKCEQYLDVLNESIDFDNESIKLKWHKDCFSGFTSTLHLNRLKTKYDKANAPSAQIANIADPTYDTGGIVSRSGVPKMEWNKCMFCQELGSLSQVQTLETSEKIIKGSRNHVLLQYRLAGISDLVAVEGKYHLKCYAKFLRQQSNYELCLDSSSCALNQACFNSLIEELESGIKQDNIYSIKTVWERYCELVTMTQHHTLSVNENSSNSMRLFRMKIQEHFGNKIEFIAQERKRDSLLIVPNTPRETLIGKLKENVSELAEKAIECQLLKSLRETDLDTEFLKSMHHVSTRIKSDLKCVKSHNRYNGIDQDHVEDIVPPRLFLLLSMMIGNNEQEEQREKILSIAQDIIFVSSQGRTLTPKHVGLASTLHHATRNKSLVQLLHAAGHCSSYETVEKTDTSIANSEVKRWEENGHVVVPPNLIPGKFTQFAGDNINIKIETLDGKGMFNATQCAAFQFGNTGAENAHPQGEQSKEIGKPRSFGPSLPHDFHEIFPSGYRSSQRPAPIFPLIDMDWYTPSKYYLTMSKARDIAWILCRLSNAEEQKIPAWTGFNQVVSSFESEVTTVGHMPIIPAPADNMDTVYTVISRCKSISEKLGQKHTVITFDQALYCRAKELVWLHENLFSNVIIRLGGFHSTMNFMKAIGQHFESSGLRDIWVESGVFGDNSTLHMLTGHAYNKAVRGHKLTFEALWRILWPEFENWASTNGKILDDRLMKQVDSVINKFRDHESGEASTFFEELVEATAQLSGLLEEFDASKTDCPTFTYWRQYMEMVAILLGFIRSEREGNWELHLELFSRMLPYFAVYDHTNYARWGPVYLADMRNLITTAPEVHAEFMAGRFSIKRTNHKFCQVASDQALEHINRIAKVSGGIVGITHLDATRDRWCLTYNERSRISDDTLSLFNLRHEDTNDDFSHRDSGPAGIQRDEVDIAKLVTEFKRFNVFSTMSHDLMCLSTSDVAPDDVKTALLSVEEKGTSLAKDFVKMRLLEKSTDFYSRLPQNKLKTLASMYKVKVPVEKDKVVEVKAERDIFRRLLLASESGRNVNLDNILKHELAPVPLSLAKTNSTLRSTAKSDLIEILCENVLTTETIPDSNTNSRMCLLMDAPALIQAIGKPDDAKTFGDLADIFCKSVERKFISGYSRVDVLFDRYLETSIKDGTRSHRAGGLRPIRRVIDSRAVKLPQTWKQFIDHPGNKSELASFLSTELIRSSSDLPLGSELVLSGGFEDIRKVWSSCRDPSDIVHLQSTHEEADTRLILHAKEASDSGYKRVVVQCRDTDVLVLIVGHRKHLCSQVWMSCGTSINPKNIPVHKIRLPAPVVNSLIAYHAVSGCDTTSQLSGKGKRTTWRAFVKVPGLLKQLGESPQLTDEARNAAEQFICHIYGYGDISSVNKVRSKMFAKGKSSIDSLPPTQDALHLHLERANYQAFIWKKAILSDPEIPPPTNCGWVLEKGILKPKLMTLDAIPKQCAELTTCSCKAGCSPTRCGCLKLESIGRCTSACFCGGLCQKDDTD